MSSKKEEEDRWQKFPKKLWKSIVHTYSRYSYLPLFNVQSSMKSRWRPHLLSTFFLDKIVSTVWPFISVQRKDPFMAFLCISWDRCAGDWRCIFQAFKKWKQVCWCCIYDRNQTSWREEQFVLKVKTLLFYKHRKGRNYWLFMAKLCTINFRTS